MAKSCLTGAGGGHVTSSAREARIAHEDLPRVYEVFPMTPVSRLHRDWGNLSLPESGEVMSNSKTSP